MFEVLKQLDWGNVPDWVEAITTVAAFFYAVWQFSNRPKRKLEILYDMGRKSEVKDGKVVNVGLKKYRFWIVNVGNSKLTVRWLGIRPHKQSGLRERIAKLCGKPINSTYEHTEPSDFDRGDDISWQTLGPGETSKMVEITVPRLTQIIGRTMDAGDTRYVDVAYLDSRNKLIQRSKIPITSTMVDDNSGLPKAPNDGIVKYTHPTEVGKSNSDK